MMFVTWFFAGGVAGCMHAAMLWRATRQPSAWTPLFGILRLMIVAAVLVLSAISGAILASAAGWALGLIALSILFVAKQPGLPVRVPAEER